MRRALSVARLELREWRALPVIVLALGSLPLVARLLQAEREEVASLQALLTLCCGTLALLWIGASVFTRDLGGPRALFVLARPLAWHVWWAGQWLAALSLAALVWFGLEAPSWPVRALRSSPLDGLHPLRRLQHEAVWAALLLGLGHWGALAVRARGWRLLADALIVLSLLFLALREAYLLIDLGVFSFATAMLEGPTWSGRVAALGIVLAGALRLRDGSGDARRGYARLATANWTVLAVCVLALVTVRLRAGAPTLRASDEIFIDGISPDGTVVSLSAGPADSDALARRSLLVWTGRPRTLAQGVGLVSATAYSRDSRTAAWIHLGASAKLLVARLDTDARPAVLMNVGTSVSRWMPSPAGTTLLSSSGPRGFEVWRVDQPHPSLFEQTRDKVQPPPAVVRDETAEDVGYLDEHTLWVAVERDGGRALERVDLRTGRREPWARLPGLPRSRFALAPDARRALAWRKAGEDWALALCTLPEGACADVPLEGPHGRLSPSAAFLSDGGMAIADGDRSARRRALRVLEADGRPRWRLEFGGWSALLGEPRPGLLAAVVAPQTNPAPHEVVFVDTATGRVVRRESDLLGRLVNEWDSESLRGPAATYFVEARRRLVRLDLDTWQRHPVALP